MRIVSDISTCPNPPDNLYLESISKLSNVFQEKHPDYSQYDIALFWQSGNTERKIKEALTKNSDLKTGIIDPRGHSAFKCLRLSDFVIVNGIEKADFFSALQPNIFMYYDYPALKKVDKQHVSKEKIIIGYHGNKVHLATIFPNITIALEELAKKYPIEFWAMYNIEKLGKCKSGMPENLPVRHIQWSMENYYNELANIDIGIVPTLTPVMFPNFTKYFCGFSKKYFLESQDDYLVRFKVPTSAGRVFVFALLGIPVVADLTPSICQFINHGQNGFIAHSVGGWYNALEQLILSHEMRARFSAQLYIDIADAIDVDKQNARFVKFLNGLVKNSSTALGQFYAASVTRSVKFHFNILLENLHAGYARIKGFPKRIGKSK